MSQTLRVAAAQLAPVYMNREATVAKACKAIVEAGRDGVRLIAFPEVFIPGYPYWAMVHDATEFGPFRSKLHEEAVEVPGPATDALCAAAREAGCFVSMGLHERDGGTLYAGQLLIGPDEGILGKRRKLVPTNHERMVWGRGNGQDLVVHRTPIGVIGELVCYEHANPLFRYAVQAQGEQIHIAGWPGGMPGIVGIIDAAIRQYAFESQTFVINSTSILTREIIDALGRGGSVSKLEPGAGYTAIVDPRGQFVAGPAPPDEETVLQADLDLRRIADAKAIVDSCGHYARPDVVRLQVQRDPRRPLEIKD